MHRHARSVVLGCAVFAASAAHAQPAPASFPPPPTTRASVGHWDVSIVKRAEEILSSPERWDRADTGDCKGNARTFGLICALNRASEQAAGIHRDASGARVKSTQSPAPPATCTFHAAPEGREGSCGMLWDELPVFVLSRVKAITSGMWRRDAQPVEVWAGTMSDAEEPVMAEARALVGVVSNKKYSARLVGYNNDSSVTFADLQKFFHLLEDRVVANAAKDLTESFDSLEIEVYAGGKGVIRTYTGWYAISGFSANESGMRFQIDTSAELPPNSLDREILQRAAKVITSDAVWNRADNRKCPATATTWSIYCAVERAEIEVTGGFHHRRPAMELVRVIVEDRAKDKSYDHRLMGYNNDPSTHLDDVRSLFAEAIAKIK